MGKGTCNGEGCIRKRKDSRWKRFFMASYDLVAGKQKAKKFPGKIQAGVKEKQKKAIGVEHIWFPDLRHTFATFSLKNGVDAKTPSTPGALQRRLRSQHLHPHATPGMMCQAVDTMCNVIGQAI